MSDFEEHKKRMPSPVHRTTRHDHHTRKRADAASPKGAQAKHDALNLPPDRHQLTLGAGAVSTYRDLPEPASAAPKASRPTPVEAEAREKRKATLRTYLLAQVTAGRMELSQAEVAMMQFQQALDEGLPSYEE